MLEGSCAPGWERVCFLALKRLDESVEWHLGTEKGAVEVKESRPDIYLKHFIGSDCLDSEFLAVRHQAQLLIGEVTRDG